MAHRTYAHAMQRAGAKKTINAEFLSHEIMDILRQNYLIAGAAIGGGNVREHRHTTNDLSKRPPRIFFWA